MADTCTVPLLLTRFVLAITMSDLDGEGQMDDAVPKQGLEILSNLKLDPHFSSALYPLAWNRKYC